MRKNLPKKKGFLSEAQPSRVVASYVCAFQLRQDDEPDRHAGFTMTPLITIVEYSYIEFDKTGLGQPLYVRKLYRQ